MWSNEYEFSATTMFSDAFEVACGSKTKGFETIIL